MKRIIPILLCAVALMAPKAKAQEVVSLSLKDCIDYALKNSVSAKNARIDVELQKAQNAEVTGRALPQISGEGKYTQFFDVQQQFLPSQFAGLPPGDYVPLAFSPKLSNVGSLNASQLLFNGSIMVALQARNALLEFAQKKTEMTNENIRANVQKSYAVLIVAYKRIELLNTSLALLRKTTNDMRITYENGMVEKIELNRLEVQLSNVISDSMGAASFAEINEKTLKYIIGMDINTPIRLIDNSLIENANDAASLLLQEYNVENNVGYQLSAMGVKLQEYDLKRYRFEGLPTLAAFGSAGYNRSSDKVSDLVNKPYPGYSLAGLQLNVPIFDGLQRRNRVKSAKLKLEQAQNNLEDTKLGITNIAQSARLSLENAIRMAENNKRTMQLANSVFDLAQKKYKAGVGSNQDVVTAQGDLLRAQESYFVALLSIVNSKADLEKVLGLLK